MEFVFIIIEFDLGSSLPFAFPWEFVKCQWDFVVAYVPIRFHGLKFREGAKFSRLQGEFLLRNIQNYPKIDLPQGRSGEGPSPPPLDMYG